ncbi:hypothetical protein H2201_000446 [Coniosporium apollinis]|uniref:Lysine-specific metallo-endopeptidase domain-containing protein n=1 Tax=Coniosporium apollinis TaxID=61459 RepID=A0ABQ9P4S3_9PEZI|nr:hypothetical protein H2201_000446 [Coniosporium apollinis]
MANPGFASLEYNDYAIENLRYNLDNAIHPIFSVTNFVSRQNFEDTDYEVLRPSLRLASLLLEEPSLLPFWYAMFYGEEKEIEDPGLKKTYGAKMFSYRRKDGELTAEDIYDTHEMLLALAKIVRFIRVDDHELEPAGAMCTATCCRMPERLTGCGARILYGERYYQALHSLETSEEPHDSLIKARFDFATLMLHELAHAAQTAILGRGGYEHFFEDDVVAEAGLAWENFVFGGTSSSFPSSEDFAICEFPHHHSSYDIDGDLIDRPPERGPVSRLEIHWPVRDEFVRRLFTKRFWQHTVKKQGTAAFRFPKDDGFLLLNGRSVCPPRSEFPDCFALPQGYELSGGRVEKIHNTSQQSCCYEGCDCGWCSGSSGSDWTADISWDSGESSGASGESRRSSEASATSVCLDLSKLVLDSDEGECSGTGA